MRIYADESGTHGGDWLIIGMLFVPDHGQLHSDLCAVKERLKYFNQGRRNARYKEIHFAALKSQRDAEVSEAWIDHFLGSRSIFRSVVIDWSIYDGRHFGNPFDPDALKRRRAYKKWAEMLLQPEVGALTNAQFYLDKLRILYGYDIAQHLKERFQLDQRGEVRARPRIREFQATESWKDANQCLQLSDLLTGCVYQSLAPSTNPVKLRVTNYLYEKLQAHGVKGRAPGYWRGFGSHVRKHFPKFSEWFWRPVE
jgi:hypothetical protein